MTALVLRANTSQLPLADASVDLIVTSPPYFGLRSYQDGGEHYAGQVGDEESPGAYLDRMVACTAEWMRVMKPSASMWVNLGDKYSQRPGQNVPREQGGALTGSKAERAFASRPNEGGTWDAAPPKSLIGVPWRYALRCIDELGLILRAEVIWAKPNGMPESVTDRVRRSHEQWFHFTISPRYYSAVDEVREAHTSTPRPVCDVPMSERVDRVPNRAPIKTGSMGSSSLGKLPGSVWSIASQPLNVPAQLGVDHFAAFPMEFPRRIILGWSPSGICTVCGEGRRPVTELTGEQTRHPGGGKTYASMRDAGAKDTNLADAALAPRIIVGYACDCDDASAPTRPAVVLDPFGGTGTTSLVADVLGRTGISVDLSHDYSRLACWRTTDPGERARAMQVAKPPAQVDGQQSLFEEIA